MESSFLRAIEDGNIESALAIFNSVDVTGAKRFLRAAGALRVTAVHLAAWQGSIELLELLRDRGADVNAEDKLGRCALHHAVHRGHVAVVEWLLAHGASTETRFGIYACPKIKPYNCLVDNNATDLDLGKKLPVPECWGRTPLHQAVKRANLEVTRLLINASAEVNVRDERGVTPLHLAAVAVDPKDPDSMNKFDKMISLLVSAKALVNVPHPDTGTTALHHSVTVGSSEATKLLLEANAIPTVRCIGTGITPLHVAASSGFVEILKMLLAKTNVELIDVQDHVGRSPLHAAAYGGHTRCVSVLVNREGNLASTTRTGTTVVDAIFGHVPHPMELITDILDEQVQPKDKALSVVLNFRPLAPRGELQMSVVSALIAALPNVAQLAVLQHPLLEAYLSLKWSRIRKLFLVLVLFHLFFALVLSASAIAILEQNDAIPIFRRILLFTCSFLLFCHNVMQLAVSPRYCAKRWETWLGVACTFVSLMVSVSEGIAERQWLLHGTSVAILLAWIQIMLLAGRFPTWGYYGLMFATVWNNVLKVLLAFVWLVVGFSLSFSILFHDQHQFRDPWKSFVKTFVMMTGEYDYNGLFAPSENKIDEASSFLRVTSRIVFLMFVVLASIVLMNLMIGLAVSDIQGLFKEGHIRRLVKQAEFVAHFERVTSHKIFQRRWICTRIKSWLASKRSIPTRITISSRARYGRNEIGISEEVTEALFSLTARNQDAAKKYERDSPSNNDEAKLGSSSRHRTGYSTHQIMPIARLRALQKFRLVRKQRSVIFGK